MMFLSAWLRRSNVLTGAEWIQFRFGRGRGANLAHLSVVFFALGQTDRHVGVRLQGHRQIRRCYAALAILRQTTGLFTNENIYAMIILGLTSSMRSKAEWSASSSPKCCSSRSSLRPRSDRHHRHAQSLARDDCARRSRDGWINPFFGWKLDLDWTGILDQVNAAFANDGNEWFGIIFGLMFFKGMLASLAGPAPNYDMQRVLATRNLAKRA